MALLCFFSLYRYPIQLATFSTYPASVEARMNSLAENKFEICTKVSEVTGTLLTPLRALLTPLRALLTPLCTILPRCATTPLRYYPAALLPPPSCATIQLHYHPATARYPIQLATFMACSSNQRRCVFAGRRLYVLAI
jgi:hypothetical protein